MKRFLPTLCLLILAPRLALAVDVRAIVDRTSIHSSESIRLTVSTSGGDAVVDISPIKDFKVSSQGTSSSVQIVNGNISRETAINYILFPLKTGRLIIPSLTVTAGGKTHQTQSITVNVSNQSAGRNTSDNIFIEADVSSKTPYEGEQIIYTFRLFHLVSIANAKFQKPSFDGFTAKEIGDQISYQTVINARQYTVSALTYALIPLNASEKTIEPAVLECDVVKARQRRGNTPFDSFFNDPFFGNRELEKRIYRSEPLTIQVKSLPTYEGDITFSGLVGAFSMTSEIGNTSLREGDSTTLSVIIEGKGNIMDAEEPDIRPPDSFKIYKDNPEEDIRLDRDGYSGKKIFRLALVPVAVGDYELPPVRLSYFDVTQNTYRVLSTNPISLHVMPSQEKQTLTVFSPQSQSPPPLKKKVELTGRDILPLNESLDALKHQAPLSVGVFGLFMLIPMMLYLIVWSILKVTHGNDHPAVIMNLRAEKSLKAARQLTTAETSDTDNAFFTHLYRALISSILSKAGTSGESLTYTEVKNILIDCGYPAETGERAAALLEKIESARFGGMNGKSISNSVLYSETASLIKGLNKS